MANIFTDENCAAWRAAIDDVFDNFDFEKVKAVMDKLDWKWSGMKRFDPKDHFKEKTGSYVPTLDEIKQFAVNLLWDLANCDADYICCGGFRAEKNFTDPDDPWMRLAFEVTDWEYPG